MGTHRHGRPALVLVLALFAAPLAALGQDKENEALRRELDELKRKVDALERAGAAGPGTTGAPAAPGTAAGGGAEDEDEELRKLREEADASAPAAGAPAATGTAAGGAAGARGGGTGLQQSLNAFNPRITVFGDFVGRAGVGDDELEEDDRMSIREVEVDFRADVDPYAKGVLILAVHEEEPGAYEVDLEEAFVTLETLPFNLRAQIGRWRQRFGQINRTHQHDLMWVEYPLIVRDFLGDEGLIADGVALMWLAPGFPIELEATVINGENATILAGVEDSDFPAFLGRANVFFELPANLSLNLGNSYLLGMNDARSERASLLVGGDVMFTWKPTQLRSIALIGEVYYLDRENETNVRSDYAIGWYGAVQVQPFQNFYVGARYDFSDYEEQIEDSDQWAGSVYASWYTTEFLRFRVGWEHRERRSSGIPGAVNDRDLDTLYFQVTFVFGSHPVEPFWVNR